MILRDDPWCGETKVRAEESQIWSKKNFGRKKNIDFWTNFYLFSIFSKNWEKYKSGIIEMLLSKQSRICNQNEYIPHRF